MFVSEHCIYHCSMEILRHKSIWILDDDQAILSSLEILLTDVFKSVTLWSEPSLLLNRLEKDQPDIVLMDMNYSPGHVDGREGLDLLIQIKTRFEQIPIVVMTGYSDVHMAVESMKMGASDFVNKPWSNERLVVTLSNVIKLQSSQLKLRQWKASETKSSTNFDTNLGMIGVSKAIETVRQEIRKVATTDANVFLLGENGTGKGLAANALHQLSKRREQPFIKIDLGSIHKELFETELFGAKKGSYTGITADKPGRMGLAHDGTLFLDEIGNLSVALQGKLLSALQNREITPVGSTKKEKIDIRLVSATNMSIEKLMNEEVFRQDLLYRINTVEINLPPLRDRISDVPLLLDYFLAKLKRKYQKDAMEMSKSAYADAMNYSWPGNIRELEHAVERAILMSDKGYIGAEDLLIQSRRRSTRDVRNPLNLAETEEKLIKQALVKYAGNITKASRELGITRTALYRRLEKYNL